MLFKNKQANEQQQQHLGVSFLQIWIIVKALKKSEKPK